MRQYMRHHNVKWVWTLDSQSWQCSYNCHEWLVFFYILYSFYTIGYCLIRQLKLRAYTYHIIYSSLLKNRKSEVWWSSIVSLPLDPPVPGSNLGLWPHHKVV